MLSHALKAEVEECVSVGTCAYEAHVWLLVSFGSILIGTEKEEGDAQGRRGCGGDEKEN